MKVEVRRWTNDQKGFIREATYEIDVYQGIVCLETEETTATLHKVKGRMYGLYVHTSIPNTLVMYVTDEGGDKV